MNRSEHVLARIDGPALVRAEYSHHVILRIAAGRGFSVDIEGLTQYYDAGGAQRFRAIDSVEGPTLSRLVDNTMLKHLEIVQDGTLTIELEPHSVVCVPPDAKYEAWQVRGSGIAPWIALPGGGVG
jgi:Family of unknown function (DUF6188)